MKKHCCLIVSLGLVIMITAFGAEPKVIDINGSFEKNESDAGRNRWWGDQNRITNEMHKTGNNALALPFPKSNQPGFARVDANRDIDTANFAPGDKMEVKISFLIKQILAEGETVSGGLEIYDYQWNLKGNAYFSVESIAGRWQTLSKIVTIPTDFTADWHVILRLTTARSDASGAASQMEAYFDDVSISVIKP